MVALFYRNPRLTLLAIGLIVVAGVASLRSLGRQEDPIVSRRFATITASYPGASALRLETQITEPIERVLQELHEIKEIKSLSRSGVAVIELELEDRYEEDQIDEIWSKVRDKLSEIALPPGAAPPAFLDRDATAITLLAGLSWTLEGEAQLALLTRLAAELENRLRNVPGTRRTQVYGGAEEEIRVTVDPGSLAEVDLSAAEIAQTIARADAKLPAGKLRHAESDLLLEVAGELTSVDRVRQIPLRREEGGHTLRVGNLGRVEKTVRDPPATTALLGGRRGVAVGATMEPGRRVDLWAIDARAVVESFRSEVPRGIELRLLFDQSHYADQRLSTLAGNLALGATIVVCVLILAMGLRSALIIATALPLTLTAVLAEFNALGVSLHQTSITGLIIALGLLIDNAIVVVDDYNRTLRRGLGRAEAIVHTIRLLAAPLAASTTTTVLAFLPILLMPGGPGEFVGPIAIGVCLSVATSYALAMTVIPALAAFFTPRGEHRAEPGRAFWRAGFGSPFLLRIYENALRFAFRYRLVGLGVPALLPILGFLAGRTLPEQFFPANDRNQFQIQLTLSPQTSIEENLGRVERARQLVDAHPDIVESHWFLGESSPRVYYNMFNTETGRSNYAGAFATTRSAAATERLLPELQRQLIEHFPDARILTLPFEQGPPFDAPIEVRLVGPDLEVLRRLGEEVRAVFAETADVTYTATGLAGGEPKLLLRADEDEVRAVGLRLGDLADQLQARLEGATGGSVLEANEEIPVRVRVAADARDSVDGIAAGRFFTPDGPTGRAAPGQRGTLAGTPLRALSHFDVVPELAGIPRRNGERVNTVQAFLTPYALISDSLRDFQRRLAAADFTLPPGYRLEFGGEDEERNEAIARLVSYALPLFVIMAGAIILAFNSFRIAAVIFCVAVMSIGLALLGVASFGYPLGFISIVGTMGLAGLAINDAIVVLAALRADPLAASGDRHAAVGVVVGATRHILATTFTTIGGFLPLILLGGRFWPPMATAIAGGVGGCAILALFFAPTLFLWVVGGRQR